MNDLETRVFRSALNEGSALTGYFFATHRWGPSHIERDPIGPTGLGVTEGLCFRSRTTTPIHRTHATEAAVCCYCLRAFDRLERS